MDNTAKEQQKSKNDEVYGSVVSKLRRRRGVKVTGRSVSPLEWENVDSYFEKINNDWENTSDASTNLHVKDENQTDHKTNNTSQTMVQVAKTLDSKNAGDMIKEKLKNEEVSDENAFHEDSVPCGSAMPRETLEELKHILKESQFIHFKHKWVPKTSTVLHFPKCVDNTREKPDLAFITLHPHVDKEVQKPEPTSKGEKPFEMLVNPVFREPALSENKKQSTEHKQQLKENHFPDQVSIASGTKSIPPTSEFKDSTSANSRNGVASGNGIPNSPHLLAHIEQIKQQIAKDDIRFVRFEAADLHGLSKSKMIPARFFQDKAVNGLPMSRSYLELTLDSRDSETDFVSAKRFNCDILLKPDLQTFRILPWTDKTARVICDSFTFIGDPLATSPRYLAKRLLNELQESGFLLNAAFTYTFSIFGVAEIINSKTISFPTATLLSDHQLFIQDLFDGMYCMGGDIESFSSFGVPGQMEVSFLPEYGLAAANTAFTFKSGLKEAAKKQGYIASFYSDSVSSGVFLHGLWNLHATKNEFHSGCPLTDVTDVGRQWLSGLLLHSAALSCLTAPGVACRKNFFKGGKEPQEKKHSTFGSNDNSCSYNIKSYGCNGTYIENKLCSATANPYLVLAATIAAGLDGIRNGLDLLDQFSSTKFPKAPQIPLKLENALSALKEDTYMRASLGEPFIQYFLAMKQYELETDEGDSERNTFLEYFI